jgi:hypothetical protein
MRYAISLALSEDSPESLDEAARQEQDCLWTDLDSAIRNAINGEWSMQCDWLVGRIAVLAKLTGYITVQEAISSTFPPVLYGEIVEAIGRA